MYSLFEIKYWQLRKFILNLIDNVKLKLSNYNYDAITHNILEQSSIILKTTQKKNHHSRRYGRMDEHKASNVTAVWQLASLCARNCHGMDKPNRVALNSFWFPVSTFFDGLVRSRFTVCTCAAVYQVRKELSLDVVSVTTEKFKGVKFHTSVCFLYRLSVSLVVWWQ